MHEVEKAVVVEEAGLSRKRFLASAAGIVVGGAFMGALPGAAKAHETEVDDVDILNFALTLEYLEMRFYEVGNKRFRNQFRSKRVKANFTRIANHENAHVSALRATITSLGGEPVPAAVYNFAETAYNSFGQYKTVAQFLENTGVTAYCGAIAHLNDAALLTTGATIATVEARHASYLNNLNNDVPFPGAFDDGTQSPRAICRAILAENGGFIIGAPTPYGPYESLQAFCDGLPDTPQPD